MNLLQKFSDANYLNNCFAAISNYKNNKLKIMKNKIILIGLLLSLTINFSANAQENSGGNDNKISEVKSEIVADLNKEKSIIDSAISCINSAAKRDDFKKCHEQKKSSMDALRQDREAREQKRIAERKQKLQSELDKLNQKSSKHNSNSQGSNQ